MNDEERIAMEKEIHQMLDRVLLNSARLIDYYNGVTTKTKQKEYEDDDPTLDSDTSWE